MALTFAYKALRAPHRAVADLAAALAWRPGPSQAVGSTGYLSFTRDVGAVLDAEMASALPVPSASRVLHRALGADLTQPVAQAAAHRAAVSYGRQCAGMFGAALPLLAALRQRGSGRTPDGGAVGHDRVAALAVPLLDLIARQFCKIDVRAVVPQETVDLMNQIEAGAGDALRVRVAQAQADIGDVHSATSVRLRQAAFDALMEVPAGEAGGSSALGLAQSASAAVMMGLAMVMRHSAATMAVVDVAVLRAAAQRRATAAGDVVLAGLQANPVPLFYLRHVSVTPGFPSATVIAQVAPVDPLQRERRRAAQQALQHDVQSLAGVARALRRPLALMAGARPALKPPPVPQDGVPVLATLSDVVAGGLHRDGCRTQSAPMTLCGPGARARVAQEPARRAVLAMGHAIGMHAAVKPLFMGVQGISGFDAWSGLAHRAVDPLMEPLTSVC